MNKIENYFDYAASTPLIDEALEAARLYLQSSFHNPSALYLAGRSNRLKLEEFRQKIAEGLGAKQTEIVFTAGGTEANNLAISGILSLFPNANVVTSSIEHESVLEPASKYQNKIVSVSEKGLLNTQDLKAKIDDNTVLVSIMYANNEIGTVLALKEVATVIESVRNDRKKRKIELPVYFHSDACQATNYLDMQVNRLGVDLLTINAGKIYAPKQTGLLFIKSGVQILPQILGGGQEHGMRSGTENLANIAAFSAAWQKIREDHKTEAKRLIELRDEAIRRLEKELPSIQINGAQGQKRLANNISLTMNGMDNERILMELDEKGFIIATGSACSASNDEPSHVLSAIGLSDKQAQSTVRITLGRYTTKSSLNKLIDALVKIVE